MLDILYDNNEYDFLDQKSNDALKKHRDFFSPFNIKNTSTERPVDVHDKKVILYSFTGTRVNRTINFLLSLMDLTPYLDDQTNSFELDITFPELQCIWHEMFRRRFDIGKSIGQLLQKNPAIMDFSKWGYLLPVKYQIELLKQKYFDFQELEKLVDFKLIPNTDVHS
jgi:ATP-dependent Lhr-like helicase